MIMMKANKQHFSSKLSSGLCIFLPVMLLVLVFSFFFSSSNSLPKLVTIPIALASTVFFVTLTKKKGSQNEGLIQDKPQKEELRPLLDVTETEFNQQCECVVIHEQQPETESVCSFPSDGESSSFSVMDKTFVLNVQEFNPHEDLQSDSSLPSDSERSTGSIMSVSFEIDHNGYQNVCSFDRLPSDDDDGDDDDYEEKEEEEDGLIEINLPSSHFYDLNEESAQKLDSKLPDFLPESILKQQCLMELLAELNDMNEDESLIEIDISMGSTNSQDFRLKQELAYLENQPVSD